MADVMNTAYIRAYTDCVEERRMLIHAHVPVTGRKRTTVSGLIRLVISTVDLQNVRIFHGSVWFVRAIGFSYFLWHAQTIRFHEIFERKLN